MVTNRDRKTFGSRRPIKIQICSDDWHRDVFEPLLKISGPTLGRGSACKKFSWMMNPTLSREMPNCSAIDLAEIRQSSKIRSWIWLIISGVVTVLGRPGQGASQVEKSPRLNWANQFSTMAYDGACYPNVFLSEWCNFLRCLALQKKKWCQLASRCCWNRARRLTCFLSAAVTRNSLLFGTWTDSSFQRHYLYSPTTSGSMSA